MAEPQFAFLVLKEHPYGREMLRQLLTGGFTPALVIEEDSAVADEERGKFLERIAGHSLPPTIELLCAEHEVDLVEVPIHSDEHCMPYLESRNTDLLVLGGTRIIRGKLLAHPRDGTINAHPGLLPECRGSASPAWSVYHDIPIGSTTHFCDDGIDTGDLLLRREIAVHRGATYEDLCYDTLVLAATLMVETLQEYRDGRWGELRHPQGKSEFPTFRNAPDEVLATVRQKLAAESYAHYVD